MANTAVITVAFVIDTLHAKSVQDRFVAPTGESRSGALRLAELCEALAGGMQVGKIHLQMDKADGTAAASGTIACTQASAVAGDTAVVGDTTFTVRTSPSTNPLLGEFAAGASDTAMGDNLAAAINAHPHLKGRCTAANAAGTVTLTMLDKGLFGNANRLSETGSSMVVTQPSTGALGTQQTGMRTYRFGK